MLKALRVSLVEPVAYLFFSYAEELGIKTARVATA
jgi:hypothetical protein